MEAEFFDAVKNLAYVFPRFAEAYDSPNMTDKCFTMLMENHPRYLARRKTEEKLRKANGNCVTEKIPQECRIPLECKVRFEFVRKLEDKFFYGMESVSRGGYTYIHVELMAESDGFTADREAYKPSVHHQMESPVPRSVNINPSADMSIASRAASRAASTAAASFNININNNHNINNSSRNSSSGNTVSSRRTAFSTTSTKCSSGTGKFSRYVKGLKCDTAGIGKEDDESTIGSVTMAASTVVADEFSTPQAGDNAEWLKAVAEAEKEMQEDIKQAKIHIDTKKYAEDVADGDKKPPAKPAYDGVSPRSRPVKQKRIGPSAVSVASTVNTRASKRKPAKQDASSVAAA